MKKSAKILRKIVIAALSATLVLSAAGCGKKPEAEATTATTEVDNTALKEEIVKFINEDIPSIINDKNTAIAIYNEYFAEGSTMDSETWLENLKTEAVVDYEVFIYNLKNIELTQSETIALRDKYVESAEAQYSAIQSVIESLETGDTEKFNEAQTKITEADALFAEYTESLKALCKENGIIVNDKDEQPETEESSEGAESETSSDAEDSETAEN